MRWIGAVLVVLCCGYFGFSTVATYKKEERTVRQLIIAINYMKCELQYRLTPLPQLLKQAAEPALGIVKPVLYALATELENQISPDASCCMAFVLKLRNDVPKNLVSIFQQLGQSLGRFDLEGQMKDLDAVLSSCERYLSQLESNREVRFRSYQTLGLCAGAALAILLL